MDGKTVRVGIRRRDDSSAWNARDLTVRSNRMMATRIKPTDIKPAYLAIGKVSVCWAHIEFELDHCMFLIYDRCDFKELKKDCPMNFRRKLEIFKLAFRSDGRLSDLKCDGSIIATTMLRFAEYRNNTL